MSSIAIAKLRARRARTVAQIKHERAQRAAANLAANPIQVRPKGAGVYLLRENGSNFVKVGSTVDFSRRYNSLLRSDNPRRLIFLGWLSRDVSDEGLFHGELREMATRLGGGIEWFELTEAQISALSSRCI